MSNSERSSEKSYSSSSSSERSNLLTSEKISFLANYDENYQPQMGIMRCRKCKQYYNMQYWSLIQECHTSDWSSGRKVRCCYAKAPFAFQIWWNIQCMNANDQKIVMQYWQIMRPNDQPPSFEEAYLEMYNRAFNIDVSKQEIKKFYLFT